jgi:hypothetical protein
MRVLATGSAGPGAGARRGLRRVGRLQGPLRERVGGAGLPWCGATESSGVGERCTLLLGERKAGVGEGVCGGGLRECSGAPKTGRSGWLCLTPVRISRRSTLKFECHMQRLRPVENQFWLSYGCILARTEHGALGYLRLNLHSVPSNVSIKCKPVIICCSC